MLTACADPNIHRWYCHRSGDGSCPLVKCGGTGITAAAPAEPQGLPAVEPEL